jgi:hypothetical protein
MARQQRTGNNEEDRKRKAVPPVAATEELNRERSTQVPRIIVEVLFDDADELRRSLLTCLDHRRREYDPNESPPNQTERNSNWLGV